MLPAIFPLQLSRALSNVCSAVCAPGLPSMRCVYSHEGKCAFCVYHIWLKIKARVSTCWYCRRWLRHQIDYFRRWHLKFNACRQIADTLSHISRRQRGSFLVTCGEFQNARRERAIPKENVILRTGIRRKFMNFKKKNEVVLQFH